MGAGFGACYLPAPRDQHLLQLIAGQRALQLLPIEQLGFQSFKRGGRPRLPRLGPLQGHQAVAAPVARGDEVADAAALEEGLVAHRRVQRLGEAAHLGQALAQHGRLGGQAGTAGGGGGGGGGLTFLWWMGGVLIQHLLIIDSQDEMACPHIPNTHARQGF